MRLGIAFLCQPNRTAQGSGTFGEESSTESPAISAFASSKSVSLPMMWNQLKACPSREASPLPTLSKVTRSLLPSWASDLNVGPESTTSSWP